MGLWLLGNLETPIVRDRVRSELSERFGIDMDYERLSLSLADGLVVRGVTVASPKGFEGKAPVLAGLGDLEVGWDFGALVGGAKRLDRIRLRGVRAAVVYDRDTGRSSVQVLAEGLPKSDEPPPPEPPVPLSGQLAAVKLPPGLGLGEFDLSDLQLTLHEVSAGQTVRTVQVSGLEVRAKLDTSDAGFVAELELASAEEGVRAAVTEGEGAREVVIRPALKLGVDSASGVTLEGRIDLLRQTLDERLPKQGGLVDLKLAVDFEPAQRRTRVRVERLDLLDGAAVLTADAVALDGDAGTVAPGAVSASATLALAKLLALAPQGMVPASLTDGQATLDLKGLTVDPVSFMPTGGSLAARVEVAGLKAQGASVRTLRLDVTGDKPGETYVLDVALKTKGVAASAGGNQVRLADAAVNVAVRDLLPVLDDPLASKARTKIKVRLAGLNAKTPQEIGRAHV